MKDNALMKTTKEGIATSFNFKNAELNKFSEQIAKIALDNVNRNIQLAKILGRIVATECYKDDGFKSAADYAFDTFGINRDFAYQLARVGNKFFNSDDEKAAKVVETFNGQVGKLAELVNVDTDKLAESIDKGELVKEDSQKTLREKAKTMKANKEKVISEKWGKVEIVSADFDKGEFTSNVVDKALVTTPADILKAAGLDNETDKLVKLYNLEKIERKPGKEDKVKVVGAVYSTYSIDGRITSRISVSYLEKPKAEKPKKAAKGKGAASLLDDEEYKAFLAWKAAQQAAK